MEQPAGLVRRMETTYQIVAAYQSYIKDGLKTGKRSKWKIDHPEHWEIVKSIDEMRKNDNERN